MKVYGCKDCLIEFKEYQKAVDHSFKWGHKLKVGGELDGIANDGHGEKEVSQVPSPVVQDGNDPQRIG